MGLIFSGSTFLESIQNSKVRVQNSSLANPKMGDSDMSIEHRPLHTEALQLPSPQRCTEHMKWSVPGPGDRRLQEQPRHEMQELLFLASNKANAFGSWC